MRFCTKAACRRVELRRKCLGGITGIPLAGIRGVGQGSNLDSPGHIQRDYHSLTDTLSALSRFRSGSYCSTGNHAPIDTLRAGVPAKSRTQSSGFVGPSHDPRARTKLAPQLGFDPSQSGLEPDSRPANCGYVVPVAGLAPARSKALVSKTSMSTRFHHTGLITDWAFHPDLPLVGGRAVTYTICVVPDAGIEPAKSTRFELARFTNFRQSGCVRSEMQDLNLRHMLPGHGCYQTTPISDGFSRLLR